MQLDKSKDKEGIINPFEAMMETEVQVVTNDGRIFTGTLRGIDQALNCILADCQERIYSKDQGIQKIGLGLYLIRGDTVALMGEIDPDIEQYLNFDQIKADPLPPIHN